MAEVVQQDFKDVSRGKRYVWVQNNAHADYEEIFRGQHIRIPKGGRVPMRYLAAERFLSQPVKPAEAMILQDGTFKPGDVPKALKIVEMTDKEALDFGQSKQEKEAQARQDEARAALRCAVCGFEAAESRGLKTHMTRAHPGMEPVKDE